MRPADPKLQAWLSRVRRAPIITLRAGRRTVGTWERGEDQPDDATLLESVLETAEGEAQETGGRIRFELQAEMPTGRVIGTTTWVQAGTGDEEGEAEGNAAALLKQAYQHINARAKFELEGHALAYDKLAETIDRLSKENAALRERIADNDKTYLDLVRLREESLSEAHTRDLAASKAAAEVQMQLQAFDEVKPLIPIVLGALGRRFLGPGVMPPAPQLPAPLESFVASVNDEQLAKIMGALTPSQIVLVQQMWSTAIEQMQARENAKGGSTKPAEQQQPQPNGAS